MRQRSDAKGLRFNIEYVGAIPKTIRSRPPFQTRIGRPSFEGRPIGFLCQWTNMWTRDRLALQARRVADGC